jgi:hypothetical protein
MLKQNLSRLKEFLSLMSLPNYRKERRDWFPIIRDGTKDRVMARGVKSDFIRK